MASDAQEIYKWIVDGAIASKEPDGIDWITLGDNVKNKSYTAYVTGKFPWKNKEKFVRSDSTGGKYEVKEAGAYILSFFTALEEDYDLGSKERDDLPDDFPKFVRNLTNVLAVRNGATLEITMNSTGNQIATLVGLDNFTVKKIIGHPAVSFDDYWNNATEKQKALVIYHYFLESALRARGIGTSQKLNLTAKAAYNNYKKSTPTTKNFGGSLGTKTFQEIKKAPTYKRNIYFDTGLTGGIGSNREENNYTLTFKFAKLINEIFLADFVQYQMNDEQNAFVAAEIVAYERFGTTTGPQEALKKLRDDNLAKLGVLASRQKKEEEMSASDKAERDAFFKQVEQCILLSKVDKLALHRRKLRKTTIDNFNIGAYGSHLPYGGRIIPINETPEGSFLNYSNNLGTLYEYSTLLSNKINGLIKYKILISKINRVEIDGKEHDVEMPLLFGEQKNIFYKKKDGSLKRVNVAGEGSTMEAALGGIARGKAKASIQYTSLSIKFHGENQATAKTNVDVDIDLSLANLNLLQAEFESTTSYVDQSGNEKPHDYTYSLLDLITYLHRSDLSGYWQKLNQNGARFFQPKFLKNRNRLILKILPTIQEASKGQLSTKEELKTYKKIKEHIEANPFILDLALIDHTIDKEKASDNAKMKVSYKGFIRSFLQEQKLDTIRSYNQIKTEITKEETLINDLSKLTDDAVAIQKIDDFNNKRKTNSKTIVNANRSEILGRIVEAEKLFEVPVAKTAIEDNVTRRYEFLDPIAVREAIDESRISPVTAPSTGSLDQITGFDIGNVKLQFFYLGDVIDSAMNNIYYYNRPGVSNKARQMTITNSLDTLRPLYKDFPIYVILPSFKPLEAFDNGDGTYSWKQTNEVVSLADFPISLSWFSEWYTKEFLDSEVEFYTLGTFINKLIGTVINNFLLDQCYLNGSHKRVQYAVKSEFGLFDFWGNDITFNYKAKKMNMTWLHKTMLDPDKPYYKAHLDTDGTGDNWRKDIGSYNNTSFANLRKNYAPFFKKDLKIPRSQYANFIVVYPQSSVFSNYEGLNVSVTSFQDSNVPFIQRATKVNGYTSQLVKSIGFTKSEANYQREARYEADNLYTLAQIASVYNCSVESLPLLNLFPGMLIYVNPGLHNAPNVRNSIANILGMGGFHIVESVTHNAEISNNNLQKFTTQTKAIWLSNGSIKTFTSIPPESQKKPVQDNPNQQNGGNSGGPNNEIPSEEKKQKPTPQPSATGGINKRYSDDNVHSINNRNYWFLMKHENDITKVIFTRNGLKPREAILLTRVVVVGEERTEVQGYYIKATENDNNFLESLVGTLEVVRKGGQ